MLPAAARMRRSADFLTTFRRGSRAGSDGLVVHYLPGQGGPAALAGFVVGRPVGSAVVRNRVRRRLRALVRARLDRLPTGSRLVVRANPGVAERGSAELESALDRALTRAMSASGGRG